MRLIDVTSFPIRDVLVNLLQDKTTERNIIFATNNYESLGLEFQETKEITPAKVVNMNLMPRVQKEMEHQRDRTRAKAEVFTPSWICNKMNNHCDEEWFGRPEVFNKEDGESWVINESQIDFPEGLTWRNYVDSRRIEITCGEAPYIMSRYDTTTGEIIPIERRIGILDRKLRVINENVDDEDEWMKWVIRAFQSVYGYEFQGDNLLIARINAIETFVEYVKYKLGREPDIAEIRKIVNIICWNFWQMDGITGTIPFGKPEEDFTQLSLFDEMMCMGDPVENKETPVCKIFDWRSNESIKYTDLKKGN